MRVKLTPERVGTRRKPRHLSANVRFLCSFLTFGVSLALLSCNRTPKLVDYPEYSDLKLMHPQKGLPPPVVVVGVLGKDVWIKRPLKSVWDPELILQLRKVDVRVENVLYGDLPKSEIEVYYFTFGMSHDGPRTLGSWHPGERMLLFLRRDSGVLRMACDGYASCARRLETGAHPSVKVEPGQPFAALLAEIFLTKGEGVTDSEFAQSLDDDVGESLAAYEFGKMDERYMREKLRLLTASPNPEIRASAQCVELRFQNLPCPSDKDQPPKKGEPTLLDQILQGHKEKP